MVTLLGKKKKETNLVKRYKGSRKVNGNKLVIWGRQDVAQLWS